MAIVSVGWSLISLAFGGRMVLAMADAKEIAKEDAPQLFNVVEEMSIASGVPMPAVLVMETDALNAFATGTSTTQRHDRGDARPAERAQSRRAAGRDRATRCAISPISTRAT